MKSFLFILVSFIAVTSTISGLLLIGNPGGDILNLPLSLLDGTPFKDFLIPGIILTIAVGVINLVAVIFNMQRNVNRYNWAIAGGIMICGWIVVQMIIIHAAHWLHFIYLAAGLLVILIGYQLKGKWVV